MGFFKSLGRLFRGRKPKVQQVKRFTPAQESALNQLMSRGMAATDIGGLEQRYKSLFERETVPDLAERFTAMGGGQRSSAFEESLRRGGMDMSERLAGLKHQGGMQALGLGLQPQFQNVMMPGSQGLLGQIMGPMAGILGKGLGGGLLGGLGLGRYGQQQQYAPRGQYYPGQPRGQRGGINPVLLKLLQGLQL